MDLLNFYVEGKSKYVMCLEIKNYIIEFSINAIKNPSYLYLFQKSYQGKH